MEKLECLCMKCDTATIENRMENSKKIKHRTIIDLVISPLGIYPKELNRGSQRDICTPMFLEALLTTDKRWIPFRCPWTDEWISKMWSRRTMEHYSALKRQEIPTHATIWTNFQDIMLSEISQ